MRISGVTMFGPLEEKEAMKGAGFVCISAIEALIYAFGCLFKFGTEMKMEGDGKSQHPGSKRDLLGRLDVCINSKTIGVIDM